MVPNFQFDSRTINCETFFEACCNRLALYDPISLSSKYRTRLTPPFQTRTDRYVDSLVLVAPSESGSGGQLLQHLLIPILKERFIWSTVNGKKFATTADSKLKRKINVIDGESWKKNSIRSLRSTYIFLLDLLCITCFLIICFFFVNY